MNQDPGLFFSIICLKKLSMKTKSACIFLVFLSLGLFSRAQEKIEKFCKISYNTDLFARRVTLNMGSRGTDIKDSTERKNLEFVKNLKNEVDILDYMQKIGWDLISSSYYREEKEFDFRKKFDADAIIHVNNNQ